MGEWSFLGDILQVVNIHSTMTGRFWLLIFVIFRIMVLSTIGDNLYEDEQEAFICNTLQPGCNQVCYDKAFPMSHYRFWIFQIMVLSVPPLSFIAYAIHSQTKEEMAEKIIEKTPLRNTEEKVRWEKTKAQRRTRRYTLYVVHVVFKLVLEIGCLVSQYFVYGFTIEAHFPCERFPCPNRVDCFVSRPTEKNVFLLYYFVINVISTLLCLIEINLIGLKMLRWRLRRTENNEKYVKDYAFPLPSCKSPTNNPKSKNGITLILHDGVFLNGSARDITRVQNYSNITHENTSMRMDPLPMDMPRQPDSGMIRSRVGSQSVLNS
ncbi:gap junction delta-3 protein-like [Lampetra fluviatilis]